ncbi:MAG: hypothetical protein Q9222_003053 [Ikaeria aurantiellina]
MSDSQVPDHNGAWKTLLDASNAAHIEVLDLSNRYSYVPPVPTKSKKPKNALKKGLRPTKVSEVPFNSGSPLKNEIHYENPGLSSDEEEAGLRILKKDRPRGAPNLDPSRESTSAQVNTGDRVAHAAVPHTEGVTETIETPRFSSTFPIDSSTTGSQSPRPDKAGLELQDAARGTQEPPSDQLQPTHSGNGGVDHIPRLPTASKMSRGKSKLRGGGRPRKRHTPELSPNDDGDRALPEVLPKRARLQCPSDGDGWSQLRNESSTIGDDEIERNVVGSIICDPVSFTDPNKLVAVLRVILVPESPKIYGFTLFPLRSTTTSETLFASIEKILGHHVNVLIITSDSCSAVKHYVEPGFTLIMRDWEESFQCFLDIMMKIAEDAQEDGWVTVRALRRAHYKDLFPALADEGVV